MAVKWNQFANNFLKSLLVLAVTFLLLSFALCLTPLAHLVTFDYVFVFSAFAFFICVCIFIPIKAIKIIVKILLCLMGLVCAPFYLKIPLSLDFSSFNFEVLIPQVVLHIFLWFLTVRSTCKENNSDKQYPEWLYAKRIHFFKNFSIFIAIVFNIGIIVLFFIDYTLIQNRVINVFGWIAFYLIVELLLIRVSRDAIYAHIKNLEDRKVTIGTLLFTGGAAISTGLFFLFKNRPDKLLFKIIASIRNFFVTITKLYKNFTEYIKRLIAAIKLNKVMRDSDFFDPNTTPENVLNDFGMGDINMGDINPSLPGGISGGAGGAGSTGGIGSIGGVLDGFGGIGGTGGSGGLGFAGMVSASLSENGKLGLGGNVESTQGNASAMAFVKVEDSAEVYLKLKSFGNYNGKSWEEATAYSQLLDSTYSLNYLSGAVFEGFEASAIGIEILSLTSQYFLPDYMAMGLYPYDIQTSDVYSSGDTSDIYRLEFFDYSSRTSFGYLPQQYREAELAYRAYVYDTYLQLPVSTKEAVTEFLRANEIYSFNSNTVNRVFNLLSNYTYTLQYDQTLDMQNDIVMSFLTEYKEGICQHFASSTVVMLRALGVPARYVGGLYTGWVPAGEWTVVTANAAHAWVEVYYPEFGWLRLDPTTMAQSASLSPTPSFSKDEYESIIKENQSSGGIGSGGGGGDDSSSGNNGSDDSSSGNNGSDDSSSGDSGGDDSSSGNNGSDDSSSGDSGSDDSSSGDSGSDDSSSGGGDGDDKDSQQSSSEEEDHSKESDEESDSEELKSSEKTSFELPSCKNIPWKSVGIGAGAITCAVLLLILIKLLKKKKKSVKPAKIKKKPNMTEEESLLWEEEVSRATAQIIRDNYKEFIKVAGKNGIRKYPADTTQSIREKYKKEIGTNEAIEILTKLYRIARYNKNEKLTAEDANQSSYCLEILQKEFVRKKKEKHFE